MNAEQKTAIAKRDAAVVEREKYQAEIDALNLRIEALNNQRTTLIETYWRPAVLAAAVAELDVRAAKPLTEAQKTLLARVKYEVSLGYLYRFMPTGCAVFLPSLEYHRKVSGRKLTTLRALVNQGWLKFGLVNGKDSLVPTERAMTWQA